MHAFISLILSKAGFLNLWAKEEFLTGHDLVLLKLSTFCKINLLIEST